MKTTTSSSWFFFLSHKIVKHLRCMIFLAAMMGLSLQVCSQQEVSLEECLAHMRTHSEWVKAEQWNLEAKWAESKGAVNLPAPILSMESPTGQFMTLGLTQTMAFPSTYVLQHRQAKATRALAKVDHDIQLAELEYDVHQRYIQTSYAMAYCALLAEQDSLYMQLQQDCEQLYQKSVIGKLTFDMAIQQATRMRLKRAIAEREMAEALGLLNQFCGFDTMCVPIPLDQWRHSPAVPSGQGELYLRAQSHQIALSQRAEQLAKHKALPGLMVGYLNQVARGNPAFYGLQFGITVPIWWWSYRAEIRSAKFRSQALVAQLNFEAKQRLAITQSATLQVQSLESLWAQVPPTQSMAVLSDANRLLEVGEINFAEFVLLVDQSFTEREQWLQIKREMYLLRSTIHHYN